MKSNHTVHEQCKMVKCLTFERDIR